MVMVKIQRGVVCFVNIHLRTVNVHRVIVQCSGKPVAKVREGGTTEETSALTIASLMW